MGNPHFIKLLSTTQWINKCGEMDLFTDLSTLSTFLNVNKPVYSFFEKNECFGNCVNWSKNSDRNNFGIIYQIYRIVKIFWEYKTMKRERSGWEGIKEIKEIK